MPIEGTIEFGLYPILRRLRRTDSEQAVGVLTLLSLGVAIGLPIGMIFLDAGPLLRIGLPIVVSCLALYFLSSQWTRPNLRWAIAACFIALGLVVIAVGREARFRDAARQARAAQRTVSQLSGISTDASPTEVNVAIRSVCAVVRRSDTEAGTCDPGNVRPTAPLSVAVATLRLRLAEYRVAVLKRNEDKKAIEARAAELSSAQADPSPEQSVGLAEALRVGGEELVEAIPGQDEAPVAAQTVGWSLVAILALAGWRFLEQRSAHEMPGPVAIAFTTSEESQTLKEPSTSATADDTTGPQETAVQATAKALAKHDESSSSDELQKALAGAPSSGVLLLKVANDYELKGKHLEALELYARAVAAHPREWVARYRLAVSAFNVGSNKSEIWDAASEDVKERLSAQLERALERSRLDLSPVASRLHPDFQKLSRIVIADAAARSTRRHLIACALRRSERTFWWSAVFSLGPFGRATRLKWIVRTAALVIDSVKPRTRKHQRVSRMAKRR